MRPLADFDRRRCRRVGANRYSLRLILHFLMAVILGIACVALSTETKSKAAGSQTTLSEECARFCGAYELTPGWLIAIGQDESELVYQDFNSGRLGILQANADGDLQSGPTLSASTPPVVTFRLRENAAAKGMLAFQEQGRPLRTAKRIRFKESEITFNNGKTTLAGTLIAAEPIGRRPGIVIIPGGGPQKRDTLQSFWWAYNGFRVLTYDKRGVGGSSGEQKEASIPDLAGDAVAAVTALKTDSLTDGAHVGILAHSEAGFVAPVVASRLRDLAFVIVLAASVSPLPDQVVHEIETDLKCQGFSATDISKAKSLRTELNEAILHNGPWDRLRREIEAAQKEGWFRSSRVAAEWMTPSTAHAEHAARYLDFDPAEYWKLVKAPILALYAEVDSQVEADTNRLKLIQILSNAGRQNYFIYTFPKANHVFLEAETGCADEIPNLSRIVPGYYHTLITWTLKLVHVEP